MVAQQARIFSKGSSHATENQKREKMLTKDDDEIEKGARSLADPRCLSLSCPPSLFSRSSSSFSLSGNFFFQIYRTHAQGPPQARVHATRPSRGTTRTATPLACAPAQPPPARPPPACAMQSVCHCCVGRPCRERPPRAVASMPCQGPRSRRGNVPACPPGARPPASAAALSAHALPPPTPCFVPGSSKIRTRKKFRTWPRSQNRPAPRVPAGARPTAGAAGDKIRQNVGPCRPHPPHLRRPRRHMVFESRHNETKKKKAPVDTERMHADSDRDWVKPSAGRAHRGCAAACSGHGGLRHGTRPTPPAHPHRHRPMCADNERAQEEEENEKQHRVEAPPCGGCFGRARGAAGRAGQQRGRWQGSRNRTLAATGQKMIRVLLRGEKKGPKIFQHTPLSMIGGFQTPK